MAINFSQEEFEEVRQTGEALYKTLGEVYCPYFKEKIAFNAHGLEHLKFKRREVARSESDQYMRFKLLQLAPEVVGASHTIQGVLEMKRFERIRVNSRTENILKPVIYYEFIAILRRNRVKVIIKQIDNGQKFFWSIIPSWGMNLTTMARILHDGTPEED